MKRKRYSEEQITFALRQAESGTPVEEVIRRLGVSEATFYRRKKKYAGLGVARSAVLGGTESLFSVGVAIIFLGERPTPLMIFGTVCVVVGVGSLSYVHDSSMEWPRWAVTLPLGAAFCFALRDVFSKVGVGLIPFPLAGASVTATTSVIVLYISFLFRKAGECLVLTPRSFCLFSLAGLLLVAAYICIFVALQADMVSLVSPIVNVYPFISVLLSYLFLQSTERVNRRVVLGSILVVGGAAALIRG